ncbi:MAG: single-stranded-DNA-specific exonuclease RecJ [Clostridia bacterium]|nr:single-stranded-DNA-specific exonuclease RecJ [Clostridia bacterium]
MHRLISRGAAGTLPGLPPIIESLLLARGVDTPEKARAFLHPDESQLHDPFLMENMGAAVRIIRRAMEEGQSIVIYGDYDCDGVCASVTLMETLKGLGARADIYIPGRKDEGYGLNCGAVRRLAENHRLLITVDCGITSVEETALARELGMTVIITDHHTIPSRQPPADVILHPQLGDYPCPYLCGAGAAYKLSCALEGKQVLPSLELCALATIADMVPLLEENRALAALGLRRMRVSLRPGLRALLSVAGIRGGEAVSGTQAAFQLAPRINACGRMETAQIAVKLLMAPDALTATELAQRADGLNARRKNIEQRILEEADAQVRGMDLVKNRVIVVMGEGWESGVVGLAAGRLAERYGYPTVALSRDGDTCVGSARSACGIDLYKALAGCADLFTRFGGHKQAAGLTIAARHVDEFRERLSQAVEAQLQGRPLMPETVYDCPLSLEDITLELVDAMNQLEPFGMGNPAPVFLLEGVDAVSARAVGAEGAHLKLTLSQNGVLRDAIAFHMGDRAGTLHGQCDLAVTPVANTFGGRTAAECRVEAVGSAQARFLTDEAAESMMLLQEFEGFCRINNISGDVIAAETLPPPEGVQGTLYLCRTAETAALVAAQYPALDIVTAPDPRAYNAVWRCDGLKALGPYRRIVLCDGLLSLHEAACLGGLYPGAAIMTLPFTPALKSRLDAIKFTVDEMRALYVALRRGRQPDRAQPRQEAMVRVLQSMALVGPECQLLPVHKSDPAQDPLYRMIQGCEM